MIYLTILTKSDIKKGMWYTDMCVHKIKPHEILPVINEKKGMKGYVIAAGESWDYSSIWSITTDQEENQPWGKK